MRYKLILMLLLTLVLGSGTASAGKKLWTKTSPAVNATHIFIGEINRRGKPTGFHAKTKGQTPKDAKIIAVKSRPNQAGVYTAQVGIYDKRSRQWKQKFSTMYPDDMEPAEIVKAVLHAYSNRKPGKSQPWRGPSGHGFPIEGYLLNDGRINTAYPIYIHDSGRSRTR
ncbi:MAG: EndoU domain-containing protein [Pseudomonadota bacterium]